MLLDERALSKLKWRSRRGMLENDLFIERFFQRYEQILTVEHEAGMYALMDLSDNDLMDLLLSRKRVTEVDIVPSKQVDDVLMMLKQK